MNPSNSKKQYFFFSLSDDRLEGGFFQKRATAKKKRLRKRATGKITRNDNAVEICKSMHRNKGGPAA
jgi:hypothetical protein